MSITQPCEFDLQPAALTSNLLTPSLTSEWVVFAPSAAILPNELRMYLFVHGLSLTCIWHILGLVFTGSY